MRMIIANRLTDGRVVFLTAGHGWTTAIADGLIVTEADAAEQALAAAMQGEPGSQVIDPNLIDISLEDGKPRPTAIREAIRAFGPTV